jgi:uncharacterized protein
LEKIEMHKIGVISDTHGLIRPQALQALQGVEHIIHPGDLGSFAEIDERGKMARVTATGGKVEGGDGTRGFPATAVAEFDGQSLYVIHNLRDMDLDPLAAGFSAVIYGHSHIPTQEIHRGILYFNPGSSGPRRFHLPPSVGILLISGTQVTGELITLTD